MSTFPPSLGFLTFLLLTVLLAMAPSLSASPTNFRKVEKKILDKLFSPSVYDSAIRPKGVSGNSSDGDDGPTKVLVNVFVRSFEKIDDVKMEFSFQITFRQQWNDNRLAFNNMRGRIKYLTMTDRGKVRNTIWKICDNWCSILTHNFLGVDAGHLFQK